MLRKIYRIKGFSNFLFAISISSSPSELPRCSCGIIKWDLQTHFKFTPSWYYFSGKGGQGELGIAFTYCNTKHVAAATETETRKGGGSVGILFKNTPLWALNACDCKPLCLEMLSTLFCFVCTFQPNQTGLWCGPFVVINYSWQRLIFKDKVAHFSKLCSSLAA